MIAYSIGRNRFDAYPERREAATWRAFAQDVLRRRAPDKASAGYLGGPLGDDGRRCAANAEPRRWLAADVDGIDPDVLAEWRLYAARWRGFGWPTASSTAEAPRERIIIELDEPVTRLQGMQLGELLVRDVQEEFGAAVRIDRCTFRAEQPCFLPVGDARPFFLLGEALNVATWLEQVPPPPPPLPPASAEIAALADARMRHVVDVLGRAGLLVAPLPNARGYAMRCPWQSTHTSEDSPGSSATALLFPSEQNGWTGAFACLHAHCRDRRLRDLLALLRRAEQPEMAA